MSDIRALAPTDRDAWLPLWRGYLDFYEANLSPEQTDLTWNRLTDPGYPIWGAIALDDAGHAIGFVHWLTHAATWSEGPYCYLEDLFVAAGTRGSGTGRALIAHVSSWAGENDCAKVYWLTHETNTTARALYDRVATRTGFIHYETGVTGP